jgi:hypothetical protein
MSTAPQERERPHPNSDLVGLRPDMGPLLARRRAARRRTRLARIDLGIGVALAVLLLLLAPGLAIVTLVAFVLILAVAVSLLVDHRHHGDGPPWGSRLRLPRRLTRAAREPSRAPRSSASQVEWRRERGGGSL